MTMGLQTVIQVMFSKAVILVVAFIIITLITIITIIIVNYSLGWNGFSDRLIQSDELTIPGGDRRWKKTIQRIRICPHLNCLYLGIFSVF